MRRCVFVATALILLSGAVITEVDAWHPSSVLPLESSNTHPLIHPAMLLRFQGSSSSNVSQVSAALEMWVIGGRAQPGSDKKVHKDPGMVSISAFIFEAHFDFFLRKPTRTYWLDLRSAFNYEINLHKSNYHTGGHDPYKDVVTTIVGPTAFVATADGSVFFVSRCAWLPSLPHPFKYEVVLKLNETSDTFEPYWHGQYGDEVFVVNASCGVTKLSKSLEQPEKQEAIIFAGGTMVTATPGSNPPVNVTAYIPNGLLVSGVLLPLSENQTNVKKKNSGTNARDQPRQLAEFTIPHTNTDIVSPVTWPVIALTSSDVFVVGGGQIFVANANPRRNPEKPRLPIIESSRELFTVALFADEVISFGPPAKSKNISSAPYLFGKMGVSIPRKRMDNPSWGDAFDLALSFHGNTLVFVAMPAGEDGYQGECDFGVDLSTHAPPTPPPSPVPSTTPIPTATTTAPPSPPPIHFSGSGSSDDDSSFSAKKAVVETPFKLVDEYQWDFSTLRGGAFPWSRSSMVVLPDTRLSKGYGLSLFAAGGTNISGVESPNPVPTSFGTTSNNVEEKMNAGFVASERLSLSSYLPISAWFPFDAVPTMIELTQSQWDSGSVQLSFKIFNVQSRGGVALSNSRNCRTTFYEQSLNHRQSVTLNFEVDLIKDGSALLNQFLYVCFHKEDVIVWPSLQTGRGEETGPVTSQLYTAINPLQPQFIHWVSQNNDTSSGSGSHHTANIHPGHNSSPGFFDTVPPLVLGLIAVSMLALIVILVVVARYVVAKRKYDGALAGRMHSGDKKRRRQDKESPDEFLSRLQSTTSSHAKRYDVMKTLKNSPITSQGVPEGSAAGAGSALGDTARLYGSQANAVDASNTDFTKSSYYSPSSEALANNPRCKTFLVKRRKDKRLFIMKHFTCQTDIARVKAVHESEFLQMLQGHENTVGLVDMFMSYAFGDDSHNNLAPLPLQGKSSKSRKKSPKPSQLSAGGSAGGENRPLLLDGAEGPKTTSSPGTSPEISQSTFVNTSGGMQQTPNTSLVEGRYVCLILDYHPLGSLPQWSLERLRKRLHLDEDATARYVPEQVILSILEQLVAFLFHMHNDFNPPLLHKALRPEAILVTSQPGGKGKSANGPDFLPICVSDFAAGSTLLLGNYAPPQYAGSPTSTSPTGAGLGVPPSGGGATVSPRNPALVPTAPMFSTGCSSGRLSLEGKATRQRAGSGTGEGRSPRMQPQPSPSTGGAAVTNGSFPSMPPAAGGGDGSGGAPAVPSPSEDSGGIHDERLAEWCAEDDIWCVGAVLLSVALQRFGDEFPNLGAILRSVRRKEYEENIFTDLQQDLLDRGYSLNFCQLIRLMLRRNPSNRPSAMQLARAIKRGAPTGGGGGRYGPRPIVIDTDNQIFADAHLHNQHSLPRDLGNSFTSGATLNSHHAMSRSAFSASGSHSQHQSHSHLPSAGSQPGNTMGSSILRSTGATAASGRRK